MKIHIKNGRVIDPASKFDAVCDVAIAGGRIVSIGNLPADLQSAPAGAQQILSAFDMASVEKLHIQRVLNYTKGNRAEAARLLNIGLTTIYRKIDAYGLN